MPTICPKCAYARKDTDTAPAWQCPSCQVAYNKVGDAPYAANTHRAPHESSLTVHTGFVAQAEKPSHTWKWILVVAIVLGIAWKGNFFSKRSAAPAGTEVIHANGQPSVVFYSATWCGYCRAARDFFDRNGIAYTELDIEKSERGAEEYGKLGGGGIPLIFIGDEKIRGFNGQLLQAKLEPWMKK
jgi:glutaredoxin